MPSRPTRRRPVLITGSHRSGSTWIGRLLDASDDLHYVQEPFNIVAHQRWLDPRPAHQFLYVTDDDEAWTAPMQRVVDLRYPLAAHLRTRPNRRTARRVSRVAWEAAAARRRGAAALIKDPIAVFSAPWFVDRFDGDAVIVVRDPVAFAGSLKERDWSFDFAHWTAQPALLRDGIADWADDVRSMAERPGTIVEQAALMWNAIYGFAADAVDRDSTGRLAAISYEAIALDPIAGARRLYEQLDLDFGPDQEAHVDELSSSGSGSSPIDVRRDSRAATETWRQRLDDAEVELVTARTADVAARIADTVARTN